jgi:cysteinyl-tRNA synthetase
VLHGDGASFTFASGESFSTQLLAQPSAARAHDDAAHDDVLASFRRMLVDGDAAAALSYLHGLMDHLARFPHDAAAQKHTLLLIREMTAELAVWLEAQQMQPPAPPADDGPWIDLLVLLRSQARAAKAWALSDAVRNALAERGITVEDAAAGSTWRRS